MEEINTGSSIPLFKKIDRAVFDRISKFKLSPGYNNLQDFYNGLDEEQQKLFKAAVVIVIFVVPVLLLGLFWWQNNSIRSNLETRINLITKANEIIGQRQSLRNISPMILSENPIDGESMMNSRLSNLLSATGVDLSKITVSDYTGELVSGNIQRSEANFKFSNLSTDELMNIFSSMIQREKFRIQSVDIQRNNETNLLHGNFRAVHLGNAQNLEEE
jgi:hypothetical protein